VKIISSAGTRDWRRVDAYCPGSCVQFQTSFHQSYRPNDLFIINSVCTSYLPEQVKYREKIAVTHLKTGKLSYLAPDRLCCLVDAYVRLEENCYDG